METMNQITSEWNAQDLRPVARWVQEVDASGRTALVMSWSVPDVTVETIVHTAAA